MSDNINLIKPIDGQRNWGSIINANFQTLAERYERLLIQLNNINEQLTYAKVITTKTNEFLYLDGENAYVIYSWDQPKSDTIFDPQNSNYKDFDAWLIRTAKDKPREWKGRSWQSGDLLILNQGLYGGVREISQWPNIMGGYFQPTNSSITAEGIQQINY